MTLFIAFRVGEVVSGFGTSRSFLTKTTKMKIYNLILIFISKHLFIIHTGTFLAKVKSTFFLGVGVSPIAYVIEQITSWSLKNQDYILFVLGAIAIDHILGSILHAFYKRDFTWRKNLEGLIIKISLAVAMGFLFEGVNHLIKEDSFIKNYLVMVLRLSVFLYPASSAFMNSSVITNGKFPPTGWINKIRAFNSNLELKELKGEVNEELDEIQESS